MLGEWRPVRHKAEPVRKLAKPRTGPAMAAIRDYVSAVPGCTKAAALGGTERPARGMGAYRAVNRAIEAGLILVEHERPNLCRLYACERDRQLWSLRRELLHGQPSATRADEILAKVEELRQAGAADYAKASA